MASHSFNLSVINDYELLETDKYDFIQLIKVYYEKLADKTILTILWDQLNKKVPLNTHEDKLAEYRDHLPVDIHKYLQILEIKYLEMPDGNMQLLDSTYKTYLITFLFFCTKAGGAVTDKTNYIASTLYLQFILLPEVGKLFLNKHMYLCQMSAVVSALQSPDIDIAQKKIIIKLVKSQCLKEEHLDNELLASSVNVIIISMVAGASRDIIRSEKVTDLTACCMKILRTIILHTTNRTLVKLTTERLFRCTRKKYLDLIPNRELVLYVVICFLKESLKTEAFERKIEYVLEGFSVSWISEEFTNYKDAIKIMNTFPEEHYKELLRKMIKLTEPKNKKTVLINVFNLISEILTTPPSFPLEKITVLYSCTVSNVLHHILNKDEQVASVAINVFHEICMANTNPLTQHMFTEVRLNRKLVNMPVESLLLGLSRATNPKWTPRNKKLFQIFTSFVSVTPGLNPVIVEKALDTITKEANPRTFDGLFSALQASFLAASERKDVQIAEMLLRLVHKFALCTDNKYSSLYAGHIFNGMLKPSVVNAKTYSPKHYYGIYLTASFDYEALFTKCSNLIREQEINLAIKNLDYKEPGTGILLCCFLEHFPYGKINTIVPYVMDNFNELSGHATAGYICTALEKILKNKTGLASHHAELDAVQSTIIAGLFEQNFPIQSIKPVFSLYETIRDILKLPNDEQQAFKLISHTSRKVLSKLRNREFDDDNAVLYLSELCLLLKRTPDDAFLVVLQNCLNDSTRMSEITSLMPDFYVQILTLLCTVAMVNKGKVHIPLRYLHKNLETADSVIKLVTIKLLYSLCREITHEFDVIIKFAFKEMTIGNPCLVRICVSILEELIHEDYIKLASQDFFRFIYILGCQDLNAFMKGVLLKRFMLSNQNDVAKFYLPSIMYLNLYGKLSNCPISSTFYEELERIKPKIDSSAEILEFIFVKLPIQKRFNIMMEISSIFEALVKGYCKVDDNFFNVLLDLIATVKLMHTSILEKKTPKNYYNDVMKKVEKQIIRCDPNCKNERYYKEFETTIRKCSLALLKLLFFENEQLTSKIQMPLFDALMHWIDFARADIIHYVHAERGKEYEPYFAKLVQFYRKNKNTLDTLNR